MAASAWVAAPARADEIAALESGYTRAMRLVADDILIAYYEDEQCRRIVDVLLEAVPAQRSPRDGLTLRGVRDALTLRDAPPPLPPTAPSAPVPPRVALPSFQELDAHLRAFVAHRWVVAWIDPVTQAEHFSAPVQCVIEAFRESARAEVDVYTQRMATETGGVLFQCTACGATRPLLDVLAFHRTVASASTASAAMSGSLAPSFCLTCTRVGTVVELGPPVRDDHERITHVIRPLLRDLDALEGAALALDEAQHRRVAARMPPVLVRARLLRVRGSSEGRTELNCDVYIGVDRSAKDARLAVTQWGPPWSAGASVRGGLGLTAREADAYRRELSASPEMLRALPSLAGKRLGCSCRHTSVATASGAAATAATAVKYVCHGHVLIDLFRVHCM